MRVIAGTCKSLPLKTIAGIETRPTTDRIKETLFNMIQPRISGCRFLDLFAGSGGIGIEALSRGAKEASTIINVSEYTHLLPESSVNTSFSKPLS